MPTRLRSPSGEASHERRAARRLGVRRRRARGRLLVAPHAAGAAAEGRDRVSRRVRRRCCSRHRGARVAGPGSSAASPPGWRPSAASRSWRSSRRAGSARARCGSRSAGRILDFVASDDEGRPFALASLRGRPFLLKFFRGHWCPYCVAELRALAGARAGPRRARRRDRRRLRRGRRRDPHGPRQAWPATRPCCPTRRSRSPTSTGCATRATSRRGRA